MIISSEDYWNILEGFLGEWIGEISGKPGKGSGFAKYKKVLLSKFIYYKVRAEFPPQKNNIDGEIHEDAGYFSYDKFSNRGFLRVFYGEGYISKYVLINVDKKNSVLIFEANENENLPPGFRAKITLQLETISTINEKFELASPGKDYDMCIVNIWEKKK